MNTCCWRRRVASGPEWWDAFQTATKQVTMLKYKDCRGTHSKEVQRCWGMRRSGRVNHQGHREEGTEKTGLQHKRGRRRRQDMKQLVMIQCQEVRMIIGGSRQQRQTWLIRASWWIQEPREWVTKEQTKECWEWIKKKVFKQKNRHDEDWEANNQLDDRWQMTKQFRGDWNERRRLLRSNKRFSKLLKRGPIWNMHTNFTQASEHWGVPSRFMHREW